MYNYTCCHVYLYVKQRLFLASSTSSACQQALAGRAAKRDEWSGVHCRQGRYD